MFIKNQNIVVRKVHDTFFLIDISQNYLNDKCSLYEINETGNFIWQQLENVEDIQKIVNCLMNNLVEDVDYLEVYADVEEYISILKKEGFLEEVNGRD